MTAVDDAVPLALDIDVDRPAWRRALPGAARLCRIAAGAAYAVARRRRVATATLVLTGDRRIRGLNRDFRGLDKPTNVLAFPSGDRNGTDLGGVVIALETTRREARDIGKSLRSHTAHLVVHGVLHLLGYDHHRAVDAGRMERLEGRALKRLGIANPYAADRATKGDVRR